MKWIFKRLMNTYFSIVYFIKSFNFLKVYFSPFKTPSLRFYFGEIAIGVPYFFPRKWVRDKDGKGYVAKYLEWFGINYCSLGWKTKWSDDDYRYEWAPKLSIVILKRQFVVTLVVVEPTHYWESWLYYEHHTDKSKSKEERLIECMSKFSNIWTSYYLDGTQKTFNYYKVILKDKYLKYIKDE